MRRKAHLDGNHREIADALVKRGASVVSLAGNGKGIPDLLVGWRGINVLMEVKRPGYDKKAGRKRQQTRDAQIAWALKWTGQYAIVTSPDEAIEFLERKF
jgi:Holliday junction resolvase